MLVLSLYAPSTNFIATEMGSAIFAVTTDVHRDKTLDKISTLTEWRSCPYYRDDVPRGWMGVEKVEGEYRGAKARVRRVARGCPRVFMEARHGSAMIDAGMWYYLYQSFLTWLSARVNLFLYACCGWCDQYGKNAFTIRPAHKLHS